jgi:hypothetical protein
MGFAPKLQHLFLAPASSEAQSAATLQRRSVWVAVSHVVPGGVSVPHEGMQPDVNTVAPQVAAASDPLVLSWAQHSGAKESKPH